MTYSEGGCSEGDCSEGGSAKFGHGSGAAMKDADADAAAVADAAAAEGVETMTVDGEASEAWRAWPRERREAWRWHPVLPWDHSQPTNQRVESLFQS